MITGLELGNIRVFENFGQWNFPFRRLNVLCGTNSAGKSTILKSLLLLVQSHSPWESPDWSGQLRLVGPLVDLGSYKTFVSHEDVTRDISVSLQTIDLMETRVLRHLSRIRPETILDETSEYTAYTLDSKFRFGTIRREQSATPAEPRLPFDPEGTDPASWTNEAYLKEASFTFITENDLSLSWTVSLISKSLRKTEVPAYEILIPGDYFESIRGYSMMDIPKVEPSSHVRINCVLRGILPSNLKAKPRRPIRDDDEGQTTYFPIPQLIDNVCSDIHTELGEIHYIGPLRSPAKRFYLTTSDTSPRMDAAGDFLPYALRDRSEAQIEFAVPGDPTKMIQGSLGKAINGWLYYLRTGIVPNLVEGSPIHEIDTLSLKEVLLEFSLKSFSDKAHALADSGFGYSQLLPIVVRGLIADKFDTIMIEQPEVHLNPALQVRIAEFLASLTRSGKNVLIETHSEHIVNTIRVLAAEDLSGDFSQEVRILYLDTDAGLPILKHLALEVDGTIPDWPRAFMGEAISLSSRLLKAQQRRFEKVDGGVK